MSSIYDAIPLQPFMRPNLNVGCIFDLLTGQGTYKLGKRGESLINGGLPPILSIAGPPNSFKTALADYFAYTSVERYNPVNPKDKLGCVELKYDSEASGSWDRQAHLLKRYPILSQVDWSDSAIPTEARKIFLTSNGEMFGDKWWELIKNVAKAKTKDKSVLTTPFKDPQGNNFVTRRFTVVEIDSITRFEIEEQHDKLEKNEIGSKDNLMKDMHAGRVKKIMMNDMPLYSSMANGNLNFILTAHVGKEFMQDANPQPESRLTHSKRGHKVKGIGEVFTFINSAVYEIFNSQILHNSTRNTGVLYPLNEIDRAPGASDLMEVTFKPTRNKGGGSGQFYYAVVSQEDGLLPHLTQYHTLFRRNPYGQNAVWGVNGDTSGWHTLALLPDVKLQRTEVRNHIDTNPKLRRAIEITSDMLQIKSTFGKLDKDFVPTPDMLYKRLQEKGFDWNQLLDTRPYWLPLEYEKGNLPYLSTMDLIRMYHGLYTKPFWM